MNISITLDLPGIIANACSTERLQPLIDKAIGEALHSAIRDATGYRSAFSEALKTQLAEALPHGLCLDDAVKFQHILNTTLTRFVHDANSTLVTTAIEQATREAMPDVPASMKVSELLALAREGFHKESHEGFYAYLEFSPYGGGYLSLDEDENPGPSRAGDREDRKHHANHRISFNKDGDVYAMHFDKKDLTPASRPKVITRFEAVLMAMYVGRTRLEVDMDDDAVRCTAQGQDD